MIPMPGSLAPADLYAELERTAENAKTWNRLMTTKAKIAIIGRSGLGKTTLCKMLVSEIGPDSGKIEWGHQAKVGYLAQDHRDGIAGGTTVYDWLHELLQRPEKLAPGHDAPPEGQGRSGDHENRTLPEQRRSGREGDHEHEVHREEDEADERQDPRGKADAEGHPVAGGRAGSGAHGSTAPREPVTRR